MFECLNARQGVRKVVMIPDFDKDLNSRRPFHSVDKAVVVVVVVVAMVVVAMVVVMVVVARVGGAVVAVLAEGMAVVVMAVAVLEVVRVVAVMVAEGEEEETAVVSVEAFCFPL